MKDRLIPTGHRDFAGKAVSFARAIVKEPQRYGLDSTDAEAMLAAATRYEAVVQQARVPSGRNGLSSQAQADARAVVEKLYTRCVGIIRVTESVDAAALIGLGLKPRKGRKQARPCPQQPPYLRFVQALHVGTGARPMHELDFREGFGMSKSKPDGAVRLELFVDLVGPDEPIPAYPGATPGSRPWYLRSYSRSPIRLTPPICKVPMLVVYWGRWADATGVTGPFSKTVVSRIEGHIAQLGATRTMPGQKRLPILEDPASAAASTRQQKYTIAVLDAQFESLNPEQLPTALPAPEAEQLRRLEGPGENDNVSEAA